LKACAKDAGAERFSYGQAASENSGMGAEAERAPSR
jgi:hypothetical protein